jgi:hypothetical protein
VRPGPAEQSDGQGRARQPARRTGTLGFRDKRCKLRGGAGEEDRPEANQILREVAEAVERIVGEPRVSRLSAPHGGAGEVFTPKLTCGRTK